MTGMGSMNKSDLVDLIVETVAGYRVTMLGAGESIGPETRLFGPSGVLDSLGLVSVLVELEQKLADLAGTSVTLMDDRAMSQTSSPFRTVDSLADYLGLQLELEPPNLP
jgi:acyl carrier protein